MEEEGETEVPKYVPPQSKPWVSQGSGHAIDAKNFTDKRPLVLNFFYFKNVVARLFNDFFFVSPR